MKNNELIAYAGIFISFTLERIRHPCKEIILFGSVARGDFDKESDIDIFFDVNKNHVSNLEKELQQIKKKFYNSQYFKNWKQKGISKEINIKVGVLKEWELARSILSDGIVLYGKHKEEVKGSGFTLISIKPIKNIAKRNKIIRLLCGRIEKGYQKEGLLEKYGGTKISPTVFIIPIQFSGEIITFLKKEKINYKLREIWSDVL